METIQEFVDRTKGPLVPYVDSWYPWVYAHHYLRTEMHLLPTDLGTVGTPRLSLDEAVELVQVWCGLTGESIEASARVLADAYLERWGVPREQIGRPRVPAQVPAEPAQQQRNQAPVAPVAISRGNRTNGGRSAKSRGAAAPQPAPAAEVAAPPVEETDATLVEERLVS